MTGLAAEVSPVAAAPVVLRFQPVPVHVRTARLVAVAVARRRGLDDERLDEVRLAVGEVCARAVRRSIADGTTAAVTVEIDDGGVAPTVHGDAVPALRVSVTDGAGAQGEDPVALALLHGLADAVLLDDGPGGPGGLVRLDWTTPT